MSGVSQWAYEYPWGRKAPKKRIEELELRRAEIARRRKKLEDRFRERMVDFERQEEAVASEVELAQRCEADRIRRRMKEAGHRLLERGVDIMDEITAMETTEEMLENLLRREREEAERPAHSTDNDDDRGKNTTSNEDDMIDDEIVSEDDLRIFTGNP